MLAKTAAEVWATLGTAVAILDRPYFAVSSPRSRLYCIGLL